MEFILDLLSVLAAFGNEASPNNIMFDYDGNGIIGSADLLVLLSQSPY